MGSDLPGHVNPRSTKIHPFSGPAILLRTLAQRLGGTPREPVLIVKHQYPREEKGTGDISLASFGSARYAQVENEE